MWLNKTAEKSKEETGIASHEKKSPVEGREINFPDSYLRLLSPELRKKVRDLEKIPNLPDWPEKTRGVPNLCLRSALFGVIKRGRRRAVKGELVAAVKGLDICYTGWRLDQGDFDVLAHALHLVSRDQRKSPDGYVQFAAKGFLRGIGRTVGKSGREWLKDSFRRLTASAVEIKLEVPAGHGADSFGYAGSLIDEFYYDTRNQNYFLKINPKLARLFDAGWTQLQWQQRLHLKTDLAKWLHGFYASHRIPFPVKVATLMRLCGSECNRLVDYRRSLRAALSELLRVGAILSWEIDPEDKVRIQNAIAPISETGRGHSTHTPRA